MNKVKLIYISGIDGCGKTTQSKMLATYLNEIDIKARYQWLRWSPSIGKVISIIKNSSSRNIKNRWVSLPKNDSEIQSRENDAFKKWSGLKKLLFSSRIFRFLWAKYASLDYYYSYKKAVSDWSSGILILDRYYLDFIIDQSLNYNESIIDFENRVNNGMLKKLHKPDLFILIDIPPEIGWERKRDGTSMVHLQQLERAYKDVQANEIVYVINGIQPVQMIHDEINVIVTAFLENCNGV